MSVVLLSIEFFKLSSTDWTRLKSTQDTQIRIWIKIVQLSFDKSTVRASNVIQGYENNFILYYPVSSVKIIIPVHNLSFSLWSLSLTLCRYQKFLALEYTSTNSNQPTEHVCTTNMYNLRFHPQMNNQSFYRLFTVILSVSKLVIQYLKSPLFQQTQRLKQFVWVIDHKL